MATPYFNPADPEHLKALPVGLRTATELVDQAPIVEADVINHYTARVPDLRFTARLMIRREGYDHEDGRFTYLRGFHPDAADASVDPALKLALRREIAEVLRWRLAQLRVSPLTSSESSADGSKTVTYRDEALDVFPPGFGRWLTDFDTREPAWGF